LRKKIALPYYKKNRTLTEQIIHSSTIRKTGRLSFLIKKIINHVCETLAYNCPVNSWRIKLHRWRGVNIGNNVFIGLHCTLDHAYPEYIYLEDDVSLAGDVYILCHSNPTSQHKNVLESFVASVVIGQFAWIGIRATILPGVSIGKNVVIGAGSVVNKDVSENTLIIQKKNTSIKLNL